MTTNGIRIPVAKWLSTPLLSDGFGGAFGTSDGLGNAEGVAGGIGAGGAGVVMSNAGATWSVSGGKAINTPVPGADAATDGGFETWASASNLTHWTETAGGTGTITQNNAEMRSGASCVDMLVDGSNTNSYLQQAVTLNANTWYQVSCYAKGATSPTFALSSDGGATKGLIYTGTASYQQMKYSFRGNITPALGVKRVVATSKHIFFDDFALQPLTLSQLLSLANVSCADVMSGAAIGTNTSAQAGLALNWDSSTSPANGVLVYTDGVSIKVDKCIAGVWSSVSTTAYTYSAGARLVVWHSGTEYRTYYNNSLVKSDTIADAGILTGTYHGLFSTSVENTLDDLTIYATGTSGEYSTLNAWSA